MSGTGSIAPNHRFRGKREWGMFPGPDKLCQYFITPTLRCERRYDEHVDYVGMGLPSQPVILNDALIATLMATVEAHSHNLGEFGTLIRVSYVRDILEDYAQGRRV